MGKLFLEAKNIGISFILLAGGEPLMRQGVISVVVLQPEEDFFKQLQADDALTENHIGGCALFQNKERVEKLLNRN